MIDQAEACDIRVTRSGNRQGGGGQGAPKRQEDKIIDAKEIQEKLKQTQAC